MIASEEYTIACNGIKLKDKVKDSRYIELNHDKECDNVNTKINLNNFVSEIFKLDDRLKDLLEMAGYIFAADRKTYRGGPEDLEYHSWARSLNFHFTVRDYDFWTRTDIQNLLKKSLLFMSGDHSYDFNFYKAETDFPTSFFDNENFVMDKPENMKVMLFSGGIDSLSGAIKLLETTDAEICLASHQSGFPGTHTKQNTLFEELKRLYPNRCKHFKYECGLCEQKAKDETQRTRSFLFTSISFAIAHTYGQDKLYVFENGITSLNFAETQDLMNSRTSRTTHPKTIRHLEKLFSAIAERPFKIEHPFLYKTKTDVVEVLKKYDKLELLNNSVSCSETRGKGPMNSHCGTCSQCIDRRFAVYATEVEDYDEQGLYGFDFLKEDLEEGKTIKVLTEYIRMAQNYADSGLEEWYEDRGYELTEIIDYIDGKNPNEKFEKLYDLCIKHSKCIEKAINKMNEKHNPVFSPAKSEKSFFNMIIGSRLYQKEVERESGNGKMEIPTRQLKNLAKKACENLIFEGSITTILKESKTDKTLSKMVTNEIKKKYKMTIKNEKSLSDYFRKLELQLKKDKDKNLIVVANKSR
ncbi:MAG: hypothetical protein GXX85_06875 [Ignavibacteria bacterium]|nr:hypothetical protein [Ignavibacteria bacterium]